MLTVTTLSVLALVLPVLAVPTKKELFRQSFFKRQGEAASADLTVVKVSSQDAHAPFFTRVAAPPPSPCPSPFPLFRILGRGVS